MPRVGRLAVVSTLLAVTAGGTTAYLVTEATRSTEAVSPAQSPGVSSRAPALAPLGSSAPVPTAAGVTRALAAEVGSAALGGDLAGQVVDASTGAVLWSRSAEVPLPPASTVKLGTALAALLALGPQATLSTGVVRDGRTLYLVGGGDVTLTARPTTGYPVPADLATLARATASQLAGSGQQPAGPMQLRVDTTAWSGPVTAPGWSPGYFTSGDIAHLSPLEVNEGKLQPGQAHDLQRADQPALQAGASFAAALRAVGVKVAGPIREASAPARALGIAAVDSPPVAALVQRMLTVSDNDLAEALGRAVALHDLGVADFAHEAAAITARLRAVGVPMTGVRLVDASGLSRLDRLTAQALVAVIRFALDPARPQLRPIVEGLPIAGLTGTLADRYRRVPAAAAAGVARAKTGTLSGVNTLSGEVVDADGRLLVFAFLTDRASGPDATEAALDRLAGRLAACGCR